MKVKSVQPTPNPNAFKFLLDGRVLATGVRNYTSPAEAKGDALAERLFAIPGVDTLFFCDNFITVSMREEADWRAVHDEVVELLEAQEATVAVPAAAAPAEGGRVGATELPPPSEADAELLRQINDLLDDRVRPALAGDGGGLEVLGIRDKTLHIRYQGACGTCPSSINGTLMAIQNLIQTEIDESVQVVSA
jgi:Fe-S cluster biogenesis protein NfuA